MGQRAPGGGAPAPRRPEAHTPAGPRPGTIRIRRFRPTDRHAVGRLERAVFAAEAWPAAAFAYLEQAFTVARPPRGRLWVAEDRPGALLGYVGVELSALGGEADVINLAVDPAHRRHGIGRRLLRAAVAYCRRRRIPLVWLRVRASNRSARAFYRRCGFAVVGRFRGYYEEPREDAVLMRATFARPGRRGPSPATSGGAHSKIRRGPAAGNRR